jgi:4-amino-4-deoxy-L-arabinose transferase-like glycosyltransferase
MSQQSDWSLPQLGDTPFLEKPPLSYWMAAASIRAFGDSPAAARLPNLLYAAVTVLAIGALGFAMGGGATGGGTMGAAVSNGGSWGRRRLGAAATAVTAALIAGTAITAFKVEVWLDPDACLLAGCALSLLGAYEGFTAPRGRSKLWGYGLMHAGAAIGFMAKSAPGWIVPALALLTLIIWERRWAELKRWELYAGLLAQAIIIGPWIYAVTRTPHGSDALLSLFWYNIVGRFVKIAAPAALDYTTGHKNSPGKYLLELPVYLLPWTFLAVAAARRAWNNVRVAGEEGTPWRFAIAAIVPFLVLISFAATARDIYAAPILLGFSVLIALWVAQLTPGTPRLINRLDRLAVRGTLALVAVIALVFVAALSVLAAATSETSGYDYGIPAVVIIAVTVIALRFALQFEARGELFSALSWIYAAHVAILTLGGMALFPTIDTWQELPTLARHIRVDAGNNPLALLQPDETTIALLDHRWSTQFTVLNTDSDTPAHVVAGWFQTHGSQSHILVKLPGSGSGDVSRFLESFHRVSVPDDGIAAALASTGVAAIVQRYELPQGRRYALLGAPPSSH